MTKQGCAWFTFGCGAVLVVSYITIIIVLRTAFPSFKNTTLGMSPTVRIGEFIVTKRTSAPTRGDIIAFHYPLNPKTTFLKRVVAVGGDTVEIRDKRLIVNGSAIEEPYAAHEDPQTYPKDPTLPEPYRSRDQFGPFLVPRESYFVLGDNRDKSSDSRFWGPVPRANVIGRVILISSPRRGFIRPS
jgi:signal peptidase I